MSSDNSARRYLCLWLPFLTADRWRHERSVVADEGAPLVFVEKVGGTSCIAASDARAHALGLHPGLSLPDARARQRSLRVVPFDASSDRAFLFHLAEHAATFTPTVALDEPNGLALDITGCAHLRGGEASLVRTFEKTLQSAGATRCRMAVAPTPDMARSLARFASRTPCFADDNSQVCTLPVEALESSAADTIALKRAGLKTIGDVARRPSVLFTARFSSVFTTKLGRTLGEEDRRITPLEPPPIFVAEHRCVEPIVTLASVEIVLAELAANVCNHLRRRDRGGRLFESALVRTDGAVRRLRLETSKPTHDPVVLLRLHRDRLDALSDPLDCGFGFDLIRLEALRSEPCAATQITLDAHQEQKEQIGQLVDRLGAMFGRERVTRLRPENTHLPERAQRVVPAGDDATAIPALPYTSEKEERPLLLFQRPQPIEMEHAPEADIQLLSFRWRRIAHKVAHADGPERIADEWWRAPSGFGTRDYYRVESAEGRRFWIFRSEATTASVPAKWFLHGLFP